MALVTVKNMREHDIILARTNKDGILASVVIPGAVKVTNERGQDVLEHGVVEVDDAELAAARKDNKVAESYFDEGALRIEKSAKVEQK